MPDLPLKPFRATFANADTGSLQSLHTLFHTHMHHILAKFEPNRIIQNVHTVELFDKKRVFKIIFDKTLTPFCKTLFQYLKQLFYSRLLELLFQCSKNYGSPTSVTMLKVAPKW